MLAFVLHKTNKYKKEKQKQQYFVFEKQTFLEHFDETERYEIISNCLITNYTKPETYNKQILDLYDKYNYRMFDQLKGEFSFGIWDKQKQTFFGGRDRVGVKPFYYYNDNDIFIYSTTLKYIKDFFGFTELNEYWIADALSGIVYDKTSTQFSKIFRMPPAHYMTVNKEKFEIKQYWELKVNKIENISEEEAIKLFREKLFNAVNSRFFPHITGTELSGGLDSSGVTSIAAIRAKEMGSKLYSYSQRLNDNDIGKYHPFKDERFFSDLLALKYNNLILNSVTPKNKGIINSMEKTINIFGAPVYNPLSYYFDIIYENAKKNNINLILSGYGGDEIVSNNGILILKDLVKSFNLYNLKKYTNVDSFIKTLIKTYTPTLYKILIRLYKGTTPYEYKLNNSLLNDFYFKKFNIKQRYIKTYNTTFKSFDKHIISKFYSHYISNRLEELGIIAREYNIEQTHPLLDIELVEIYLNIPNKFKYNKNYNRTLFRMSLRDILPLEILYRNDKTGATIPTTMYRIYLDLNKIKKCKSEYVRKELFNKKINVLEKSFKTYQPIKRFKVTHFLSAIILCEYFELRE